MTPSEIELMARRRFNAVNDTFFAQQEIFDYIYAACLKIADEAQSSERTYTTDTVIGQQDYDFPTNAIGIKRVTWDGKKLEKIEMSEDDFLTNLNAETTDTGNPAYYFQWESTIYLRPVPASVAEIKIFAYNEPSQITSATAVIEVPSLYHVSLITYVLACMKDKDKDYSGADRDFAKFDEDVKRIRQSIRRLKRTDKMTSVKDENLIGG